MPDEFYNPLEINSKTENSEKSENLEIVGSGKGVSEENTWLLTFRSSWHSLINHWCANCTVILHEDYRRD